MLRRLSNVCLLRPEDLTATREDLDIVGVFNPGAVDTAEGVVLLARVAERPRERRPGRVPLPRYEGGSLVVDWEDEGDLDLLDARVVRNKRDGRIRLTSVSHLRVFRCGKGHRVESEGARLEPREPWEAYGLEDARITPTGEDFHITYVAVSSHGAATALASTRDFLTFHRHGIILPPENKDVVLFPDPIGGTWRALHRPNAATPFCRPEMWIASSPDLLHWGGHAPFLGGGEAWELGRVGAGAPPLRLDQGWLELYHGNSRREGQTGVGAYAAGALLLDLEDPRRILGRCAPILLPETSFETSGFVPDVVFPTGIVRRGDTVLVYYGAADTCSAVVELSLPELMAALR